ncbi:hypothetical protein Kfla_1518 [Kribbella flavida DSM 17836]|uniref:Uncharacterized protein n=1 Tax=Kribbella flavida (strain DSM 17836 / JCM 10339 / NBRC 14399) TaxID=479435 RepID=D2PLI7_KRIFD|nr:hypothetical protein [Kribbella flavida]ADB30616.1 hypothetical protein Kfla_1518 [Kribbella flavida DSM 17836]
MSAYQQGPPPGGMPQGQAPVGAPQTPPTGGGPGVGAPVRGWPSETKAAYKTTELIAYVAAVLGVLIAAAVVGEDSEGRDGFGADHAWLYVTLLTIGYLISRGLAKSGSRYEGQ